MEEKCQGTVLISRVERKEFVDRITGTGNLGSIRTYNIAETDVWNGIMINWQIDEGTLVKNEDAGEIPLIFRHQSQNLIHCSCGLLLYSKNKRPNRNFKKQKLRGKDC